MDNNFDNTPKDDGTPVKLSKEAGAEGKNTDSGTTQTQAEADAGQKYTDPNADQMQMADRQYTGMNNAGQQPYGNQQSGYNYNYNQQGGGYNYGQQDQQNGGYSYGQQNPQNSGYNYNQQNNYNYQDNYSYNTGNNGNYNTYESGQDTSPMSMGDWILTILAAMIPCGGIVIYFIWAFSKSTNINRRNFCRAQLVIMGIVLAIYLIFVVLFGTMIFSAFDSGMFY